MMLVTPLLDVDTTHPETRRARRVDDRSRPFAGQLKRISVLGLSILVICFAGAAALYVVHRTMPPTPELLGMSERSAGAGPARPAGTNQTAGRVGVSAPTTRPPLLDADGRPIAVAPDPGRPTRVAGDVQVTQAPPGGRGESQASLPTGSTTTAIGSRVASGWASGAAQPASGTIAAPGGGAIDLVRGERRVPDAHAGGRRERDAIADASGAMASGHPGSPKFPPQRQVERAAESATARRADATAPSGGSSATQRGGPSASVALADVARPTVPPPIPTGISHARLEQAQNEECGGAGVFSRMVCNERVRLRYCRGRWNEHPDCVAQQTVVNH